MKNFTFILLLLSFSIAVSGQKYDYQWPMGYGHNFDNYFGISILDFNEQTTSVFPFAEPDIFGIGGSGSFICDEDGQLILMTNNCFIVDKDLNIIEGADTLTPSPIYNQNCNEEWGSTYPSSQCSLFLPEINNDSIYYLINQDLEIWDVMQSFVSRNVYLHTIIQKTDGSFYVKEKRRIMDDIPMIPARITSCIHEDEERWWTWMGGYNTNRFYKFLIGGTDTIQGPFIQEIGIPLNLSELDLGQTAFSPNTEHLAINNEVHGVMLYDFDNATGELSNFRTIEYPNMNTAQGLVFSPSSRFIYTSTAENMYQIDLAEQDTSLRVIHLGHYRSVAEDGWPVGLGLMYLGPDCRIYVSPGTTTWYLHTIHNPDEKGLDCQFEERAIRMPTNILFNLPNLPMYRFDGQCDSTIFWDIVSATEEVIEVENTFFLHPNPVPQSSSEIFINPVLPQSTFAKIKLYSIQGQLLSQTEQFLNPNTNNAVKIPQNLAVGIYLLNLTIDNKTISLKFAVQ